MTGSSSNATFHMCNLNIQFQMKFTPEQCNTKWKNLLRVYKKFVDNSKTTGAGSLPLPPYYNQIHALVHDSQALNPTHLIDSGVSEVCNI